MDRKIIHRADTRGYATHGWLESYHTFSFANYYNPERIHFGVLRVLNDDRIDAGMGFGTHPHENMEIISIPLEGDLQHKDSMGNTAIIRQGDIQVMSAGTGIQHSEFNPNADMVKELKEVSKVKLWVKHWVLRNGFCPWADAVYTSNTIRYVVLPEVRMVCICKSTFSFTSNVYYLFF